MTSSMHPIVCVEQFHLLFLDLLGRKVDKRHYALKGGCNLRFFLKSVRYSEDMDLDVQALPVHTLQEGVNQILAGASFSQILRARGMAITHYSAPKQTETTQRWKITLESKGAPLPLHTKIEFSRRGLDAPIAFEPVDSLIVREHQLTPILVSHYPPETAFLQKVHALIHRSQTQARDVFDLAHLIRSGASPHAMLTPEQRQKAQENAMSVSFDVFKSHVLSFLSPEYQGQYDAAEVWEDMVLRVVESLKGAAP